MPWTFYSALGQKLNTLATAGGASALQVNDSVAVALGTGSDSKIYYDGTDSHWDLRDTGTGDLIIAQEACHPSPDPGQVHLWAGSAGSVPATTTSQLTIEDNTNTGISILPPACAFGAVYFGDPGSNIAGGLLYNHGACRLCVRVEGNNVYWMKAAAMGFPNGAACAPSITFTGDTNTGLYHTNTADTLELIAGGGGSIRLDSDSKVYIKDTQNCNMGRGLTINQGGYDNIAFALKSSDVGTSLTAHEADSYLQIKKKGNCTGGFEMFGLGTCSGNIAAIHAIGCGQNTGKNTSSPGMIDLRAGKRNTSNNGIASLGSDGNLVTINDHGVGIRFIFDVEGTAHADVGTATYDDYNDVELLRGFLATTCDTYKKNYQDKFGEDLMYNQQWYEDNKLIGKCSIHYETRECGRVQQRAMVNMTGLTMLHHSTIIQMNDQLTARIDGIETQLKALTEGK